MSNSLSQPFPVTRWSLISRARGEADAVSRQALDELLRRYLPALKAHLVLSRKLSIDQAEDLLQSFVASRFVEQNLLGNVGPEKGRFRTFLLRAMNNYLIDQIRAARTRKRGGGSQRSLDELADDALDPADPNASDPAGSFDLAWARQVIDQAGEIMRAECAHEDRLDIWEVFRGRILLPALDGSAPTPYQTLVEQFGYETPDQAANVLVTAKRSFQRALRRVVADYCSDEDVEAELRELQAAAARPNR